MGNTALSRDGELARLRAKTDLDLAALLDRAIERCSELIESAALADAESLYRQITGLVPLMEAPPGRIASLTSRAVEIGSLLESQAVLASGK